MSGCRGSVLVGPAGPEGRAVHYDVVGQLLDEGAPVWIFTSIPVRDQSMVASFRLRADGVGDADVVRVGTALALYTEPGIGEIGGGILDHLGVDDTYDVAVTPDLAVLARPIADLPLVAVVTGDDALAAMAPDLAVGHWQVLSATPASPAVA